VHRLAGARAEGPGHVRLVGGAREHGQARHCSGQGPLPLVGCRHDQLDPQPQRAGRRARGQQVAGRGALGEPQGEVRPGRAGNLQQVLGAQLQVLGVGEQGASELVGHDAARVAHQQPAAHQALERRDPAAHHRLRHAEHSGGAGEAPLLGHRGEGAQVQQQVHAAVIPQMHGHRCFRLRHGRGGSADSPA